MDLVAGVAALQGDLVLGGVDFEQRLSALDRHRCSGRGTASTLPATSAATGTTKACTPACELYGVRRSAAKYQSRPPKDQHQQNDRTDPGFFPDFGGDWISCQRRLPPGSGPVASLHWLTPGGPGGGRWWRPQASPASRLGLPIVARGASSTRGRPRPWAANPSPIALYKEIRLNVTLLRVLTRSSCWLNSVRCVSQDALEVGQAFLGTECWRSPTALPRP